MTVLPGGYQMRTPDIGSRPEIYAFIDRCDREMTGVSDFTLDDLESLTKMAGFDPARDWWEVREGGELVGLGMLWPQDPQVRYAGFNVVDRAHAGRGLGTYLLETSERRARQLAAASPAGAVGIHSHTDRVDEPAGEILRRAGWTYVLSAYTMTRSLPLEARPVLPPGLTIRTSSPAEARLIHELTEDTFSEHFGHAPERFEDWAPRFLERTDADPSLWFIAEMEGEPVGISLASVGEEQGWVGVLGVRKGFRGRNIGRSLLLHCFKVLSDRECDRVGLGVDAGNETGAVALYESVGMTSVRIYDTFEKTFTK